MPSKRAIKGLPLGSSILIVNEKIRNFINLKIVLLQKIKGASFNINLGLIFFYISSKILFDNEFKQR